MAFSCKVILFFVVSLPTTRGTKKNVLPLPQTAQSQMKKRDWTFCPDSDQTGGSGKGWVEGRCKRKFTGQEHRGLRVCFQHQQEPRMTRVS